MKILLRLAKEAVKYKWMLILAALSTLMLTGINLLAPRFMAEMTAIVAGELDDEGLNRIIWLALYLLGIYILRILFRFLSNYMSHRAAWRLVEELRVKVYEKLQGLSMDYFRSHEVGDLISRTISDTATFEQLYAHLLPETVTNIITVAGVTIILFFINAKLALLTCIPIPFILFSGYIFATKVRPCFRANQKTQGKLSAQLQDNFSGVQEIQSFGQQSVAAEKVAVKAKELRVSMLRALKLSAIFHPSVEFLTALGTVIVVGFGGYFAYQNQLNVEDIVAFMLYLSLFYAPITSIAQLLESMQQALAGAERVIEVLDAPETIHDIENAKPLMNAKGSLSFKNVSFHYVEDVNVLNNVSFEVKAGQMLAIVGATGVGKSTIAQLISRFYDPVSGNVYFDGQDIKDLELLSLRKNIAMVLQDTFLFNGTIAENIAFAAPHATEDEIIKAAKIARIHEDIMNMPDGYATRVGERGTRLSGGQKQRIAIARAVICNAPVLVLDEATASVDVQTEAGIQQAIMDLAGSRTIVAIAHRLSTIKRADVILVFKNGEIVQKGSHDELHKQEGLYRELCSIQEVI